MLDEFISCFVKGWGSKLLLDIVLLGSILDRSDWVWRILLSLGVVLEVNCVGELFFFGGFDVACMRAVVILKQSSIVGRQYLA